jgi:hypothetical protein
VKASWTVAILAVVLLWLLLHHQAAASDELQLGIDPLTGKPYPPGSTFARIAAGEIPFSVQYPPGALTLPPAPPSSGGSSTPVADSCRKVYAYNDPSRYVGHQDQRVQGVSTANSTLSKINCGAIGLAEKGLSSVKHFVGKIF